MIVTCPSCARRYSVAIESLGEGRVVRCSVCSKTWFQPAMDPDILNAFAPEKPITPQTKSGASFRWGLVMSLSLLGLVCLGVMHPRIVSQFPSLALVCRALHIPIEIAGEGLEICNVTSSVQKTDQGLTMVLSGKVANVTNQPRTLPSLKIVLIPHREATGTLETIKNLLHLKTTTQRISWTHKFNQQKLLPNEEILFETDTHPIGDGEFWIDISFEGAPK
ncbi:MAG: zinc-ribbon domain-containing protein [Holosporales bacterium]|jgi:predicted Zn finger-like uncharacterized protein|nr:zinc-ribbon domain-containing protein [Holosporales bacterium]